MSDRRRKTTARPENFFNINDPAGGIPRELAPGIETTIFPGERAMLSVVRIAPNARGKLHHYSEEQWGLCLAGSGTRIQGDVSVPIGPGDFWRTPGSVPHTIEAGPEGLTVLDVFAPPREAYRKAGSGFGTEGN